jgi:hypothetical protein
MSASKLPHLLCFRAEGLRFAFRNTFRPSSSATSASPRIPAGASSRIRPTRARGTPELEAGPHEPRMRSVETERSSQAVDIVSTLPQRPGKLPLDDSLLLGDDRVRDESHINDRGVVEVGFELLRLGGRGRKRWSHRGRCGRDRRQRVLVRSVEQPRPEPRRGYLKAPA